MSKSSTHPSRMTRKELERELLASREMIRAYNEAMTAQEVEISQAGLARLQAAAYTVRQMYGH